MRRKIVKQGHNTLTITLPAKWAKNHHLNAGDELEVTELPHELVFSTEKRKQLSTVEIDISKKKDVFSKWLLAALYKRGINEINIKYKNASQIKLVKERIKECLMGFEIVEQSKTKIKIRLISPIIESEFDTLLRRLFLVSLSLAKSSLELIESKNIGQLNEVLHFEETNDNLVNICERILVKQGYKEHEISCFLYVIVWQLEKIADQYKHLCQYLAETKKNLSKDAIELYAEINQFFEDFYNSFYSFNDEEFEKLINRRRFLLNKVFKLNKKQNPSELQFYFTNLIDKIGDLSGSYLAINY